MTTAAGVTRYTWWEDGLPKSVLYPNNTLRDLGAADAYDRADRVRKVLNGPNLAATPFSAYVYTYDANNNMESMADSLGTSKFDYDALDRVTAVKDSLGRNLGFGYDAVGNRTRMTYPNGGVVSYAYYDNDWLHTMTDTAGGVTSYTRNGVGQMTRTDHANAGISAGDDAGPLPDFPHL